MCTSTFKRWMEQPTKKLGGTGCKRKIEECGVITRHHQSIEVVNNVQSDTILRNTESTFRVCT